MARFEALRRMMGLGTTEAQTEETAARKPEPAPVMQSLPVDRTPPVDDERAYMDRPFGLSG